jgi:probable HAF family extracellular repeat protein
MKCRLSCFVNAVTVFAALAIPVSLAAQDNATPDGNHKHHHYQLVDPGTFGGPASYNESIPPESIINTRGAAVGGADTSVPDPFPNNCFGYQLTCVVTIAYVWQGGVLTDLGALIPGYSSFASAINARGEVVGLSENGQIDPLTGNYEAIAVLWRNGIINNLGTLGGNQSAANAINDRGQVVGAALNAVSDPFASISLGCPGLGSTTFALCYLSDPAATETHAFRWTEAGGMRDLGTLGGPDSSASFVNRRGQIAGESFTSFIPNSSTGVPTLDPFFWEHGKMEDIGTLGGTFGQPNGMNNSGQVVGVSNTTGDQAGHAFLWDQHQYPQLRDLGTVGGSSSGASWINDAGEIVGSATNPSDTEWHPFLWKNGVMADLGAFGGETCSGANSINSRGQIVGTASADCNFDDHAFLSENGGPLVDLQSLVQPGSGVTLVSAFFINDRGEIAARGNPPRGIQHAVLLIPCDENHPGVEGCDYSLVDEATAAQSSAPRYVPSAPQRLPQSRRSNRYHMPGRAAEGGTTAIAAEVSPVPERTPPPPVFFVSLSPLAPSSVSPGGSSTSAVTAGLTGIPNAVGTAALTCSVQPSPPLAPTCAISPASLSFPGAPAKLTVSTVGPSGALLSHRDNGLLYALWLPLIGLVATGAGLVSGPNRHKGKLKKTALVCALFAGLTFPLACGGGNSQRTPPGTYTIGVTATAFIPVNTSFDSKPFTVQ